MQTNYSKYFIKLFRQPSYGSLGCLVTLFLVISAIFISESAAQTATQFTDTAYASKATGARLGGDEARTRFVVDLEKKVPFRVFALADPYRAIIDLPEINFQLPDEAGLSGKGVVSAYRFGLFAAGKSRIVLDLKYPVKIEKSFILPPQDGQPARLVVDFLRTDRSSFLNAISGIKPEPAVVASPPPPPVRAPGSVPQKRNNKLVIVLDPGHGGVDGGASSKSGAREKNLVLSFAKVLEKKLRATGRYIPVMTRSTDVFVPLRQRVAIARENGAALFISLHADKFRSAKVRGATVYTLSERASDKEAAALARGQNSSDIIAGINLTEEPDEVTDILIDLAQRETKNFSVRFAQDVISSMRGKIVLNKNPHRFAGFRVLKAPDVPSVLIELGFLSNEKDVKDLQSSAWRKRTATALTKAVDSFFRRRLAQSQ